MLGFCLETLSFNFVLSLILSSVSPEIQDLFFLLRSPNTFLAVDCVPLERCPSFVLLRCFPPCFLL